MGEVCVLPDQFTPSSKGTCILSLYIILPSFIKIGQELFEIIDIKTDRQTHRLTDRNIHADENNTCPKTKFLGQVIKQYLLFPYLVSVDSILFSCLWSLPPPWPHSMLKAGNSSKRLLTKCINFLNDIVFRINAKI